MKLEWMGPYRDIIGNFYRSANGYSQICKSEIFGEPVTFSPYEVQIIEHILEHAEEHRNQGFRPPVQPYGDIDNESAAHGAEKTPPGSLRKTAFHHGPRPVGRISAEAHHQEAQQDAAQHIEEPDQQ